MGCFPYTGLTFLLLSMHTAPGTGAFMLKPLDHPGAMAFPAVKVDGYDDAFRIIDDCAVSGEPTEELFDAVRFVDKNAYKIYPDLDNKQALWKEAHGSCSVLGRSLVRGCGGYDATIARRCLVGSWSTLTTSGRVGGMRYAFV